MATHSFGSIATFTGVHVDPNAQVFDFSGLNISAADVIVLGGDEELALFSQHKTLFLLTDLPEKLSSVNFTGFDNGGVVLIGDDSPAHLDDDLPQTRTGSAGNDILIGLGGNDVLNGGDGDDFFYSFAGRTTDSVGNDSLNGGNGFDLLIVVDDPIPGTTINVNLATGVANFGSDGTLTLTSIEAVIGSFFADILTGSTADNYLDGLEGNDTISGGGGNDMLVGREGNDVINGDAGNDTIRGGQGNDIAAGGAGDDTYFGYRVNPSGVGDIINEEAGGGNDTIVDGVGVDLSNTANAKLVNVENATASGSAAVTLIGNGAANLLTGNSNGNTFRGGAGNDTFQGGGGKYDIVDYSNTSAPVTVGFGGEGFGFASSATEGNDTFGDIDMVVGSSGNDTMTGSAAGSERFRGNEGNDVLSGGDGAGFDELSYFQSQNSVFVNLSDDSISSSAGPILAHTALDGYDSNATLAGVQHYIDAVSGFEHVTGGRAGDLLVGDQNDNALWGFAGDDTLIGGQGNDTLEGYLSSVAGNIAITPLPQDTGIDEANYDGSPAGIFANLGSSQEVVGAVTIEGGTAHDGFGSIDTLHNIDAIRGSEHDDWMKGSTDRESTGSARTDPRERFEGGDGADTIDGGSSTNGEVSFISWRSLGTGDANTAGIAVNLSSSQQVIDGGDYNGQSIEGGQAFDGWQDVDTLSNIDGIWASDNADWLFGGGNSANAAGVGFEFFQGFAGDDTINGGDGGGTQLDRADYNFSAHGIVAQSVGSWAWFVSDDGFGDQDILVDIQGLRLSNFNDSVTGGAENEFFEGGGGNDTINGGDGTGDTVLYRFLSGAVQVRLDLDSVTKSSGGADSIANIENATGTDFNDFFVGQLGQDNVINGWGGVRIPADQASVSGVGVNIDTVDYSFGASGTTIVNLGAADVEIVDNPVFGSYTALAGTARDSGGGIDTLISIERVHGSNSADYIRGSDTSLEYQGLFADRTESFRGNGGDDTIDGGSDSWGDVDFVDYGNSSAQVVVNLGQGTASGAQVGNDIFTNIDGVTGGSGNDVLTGGSQSRSFSGGFTEFFNGGAGDDTIDGQGGFDVAIYQNATGSVFVNLSNENRTLQSGTVVFAHTINAFNATSIAGGLGVDQVFGIESVRTGNGNDLIWSQDFDNGYANVFEVNGGSDTILGGSGRDMVSYRGSPAAVHVDLGRGFAQDGWGTIDMFSSVEGAGGSDFDDTLIGGSEVGPVGEVWAELFEGRAGNDYIDGGDDSTANSGVIGIMDSNIDIADYRSAPSAVTVNLSTGRAQDGYGGEDTLVGIEGVIGSRFGDTFIGSDAEFETFQGRAGNDTIDGGDGIDEISYDFENGVVVNLGGDATMLGGDTIAGGTAIDGYGDTDTLANIEYILGSTGDDYLIGSNAANQIEGVEGSDTIRGNAGNDTLIGGDDGEDEKEDEDFLDYSNSPGSVEVDLKNHRAFDGFGDMDVLVGKFHGVIGSDGSDAFFGDDGDSTFVGGLGDDYMDGGEGVDWAAYVFASGGVSVNLGIGEADGADGADYLVSIEGVIGSDYNDTLLGGSGNNYFKAGLGDDLIDGGAGTDRAYYDDAEGAVTVTGGGSAGEGAYTVTGALGTDTLSGIEVVQGTDFSDLFISRTLGFSEREVFGVGTGGNDTVQGGGTGQTVLSIFGSGGQLFNPTNGAGTLSFDGRTITYSGVEGFIGDQNNDSFNGDGANNYFQGAGGNDVFNGNGGFDTVSYTLSKNGVLVNLSGGSFTGTISDQDGQLRTVSVGAGQATDGWSNGNGDEDNENFGVDTLSGVEAVDGSEQNDFIVGNGGNNRLNGNGGDDEFRPGQGSDTIIGGAGTADRVNYAGTTTGTNGVVVNLQTGLAYEAGKELVLNFSNPGDSATLTRITSTTNPIVGSWSGSADTNDFVFTFFADGTYMLAEQGSNPNGQTGMERGTYAWNPSTGAFSVTVLQDTNGEWGLSHSGSLELFIEGDSLFLEENGDPAAEMTRVASTTNPIVGAWTVFEAGNQIAITFLANGDYFLSEFHSNPAADPSGTNGMERGTWLYNPTNSGFTITNTHNTNGEWGLFPDTPVSVNAADVLSGIEQVVGTVNADRITGSTQEYTGRMTDVSEVFSGAAGNDTIDGGSNANGEFDIANYNLGGTLTHGAAINANLETGVVTGGGGNDTLINIDMVIGTSFNDTLTGGSQSRSGSGSLFEAFRGMGGNDVIDGKGGQDRVDYQNASGPVTVTLGNGTLAGGSTGADGVDVLRNVEDVRGSAFSDVLNGGGTHNAGTAYDYEVFEGMAGNDTIDGKGGHDIAMYSRSTSSVYANLGSEEVIVGDYTIQGGTALDGHGTIDTLISIEQLIGSDHDDYLFGSSGNDQFRGGAGFDLIVGGDGFDVVHYVSSGSGVTVDLGAQWVDEDGFGSSDELGGIEGVRGSAFDDYLVGSDGDDYFAGLAGNDEISGGNGNDTIDYSRDEFYGGASGVLVNVDAGFAIDGFGDTDTLDTTLDAVIGTRFNDTITGHAGDFEFIAGGGSDEYHGAGFGTKRLNYGQATAAVTVDFLDAGTSTVTKAQGGTDTFEGIHFVTGSAFNDTFTIGNGSIDGGGGVDLVKREGTMNLFDYANVENGTLLGTGDFAVLGNDIDNLITGNAGNNGLNGHDGNDTLLGGAGNDELNGATGNDSMAGGTGDDSYVVDASGDVVSEALNAGNDTVLIASEFAGSEYVLGANVENATLFGTAGITLRGNDLANWLTGNVGNNTLRGFGGNDTLDGDAGDDLMDGGLGNDSYVVDSLGDVIVETGTSGTADSVEARINGYKLGNFIENLTLFDADGIFVGKGNASNNLITGNSYDNQLFGDLGNDTLVGGGGSDRLYGGAGADRYVIDGDDTIIEVGGSAGDLAIATATINLGGGNGGGGIENVQADAGAGDIGITGNRLGNNILGNAGNNTLNGGAGVDTLNGGAGSDLYILENEIDSIVDTGGSDGIDEIQSTLTVNLGVFATIENVTLLGSANVNATGNTLGNVLVGNSGNNVLNGMTGADTMTGGDGDDSYFVDNAGDEVNESGSGTDLVTSSLSYTLGENLENLTLTGAALLGTGNELDNALLGNAAANTLTGLLGNDTLDGAAGADSLAGGEGADVYIVDNAGDRVTESGTDDAVDEVRSSVAVDLRSNTGVIASGSELIENVTLLGAAGVAVFGNDLDNALTGNSGANSLTGGAGSDTLRGGAGNDTYSGVVFGTDTVEELPGGGTDTVIAVDSPTYWLQDNVENLVLGANAFDGIGNALANRMTGNLENNSFDGGAGNDTMEGLAGDDTYAVDSAGDVVIEALNAGTDRVYATISYTAAANIEQVQLDGSANLNATGNALANLLLGNSGNNILDGKAGADEMQGGDGDDTYVVDNLGDVVTESGSGTDLVQSAVNFTLGANLEKLTLTGAAISGTGNELDNVILGNAAANILTGAEGNDTLEGAAGNDTLIGGDGDDVYIVNATTDRVREEGTGIDEIRSTVTVSLAAAGLVEAGSLENIDSITLLGATAINATGNSAENVLTGNSGANILDGGLGADEMYGGAGNDTYIVDNLGDFVSEAAGGGTDLVKSLVDVDLSDSAGEQQVENIELLGSASLSAIGNALRNSIKGNLGNNTLDGGQGVDTMIGGAGDDTYYVDSATDVVTEATGTVNGANDVVIASVSYTLAANVETLQLSDDDFINGTGNAGTNTLIGGSGDNMLNGGAGADSMVGGQGNDVYVVDVAGDRVDETGGGGIDEVRSAVAIDLSVSTGVVVTNEDVEHVTLTGAAAINATGNALDNRITGNSGNNSLSGGAGNDTLDGGLGNDTLVGGEDDDVYVVNVVGDRVRELGTTDADEVRSMVAIDLTAAGVVELASLNNIENVTLLGAAGISAKGNAGNNVLTGNAGNNSLTGNAGNDTLDGGAGNDTMIGDSGDDTYFVDSVGDRVRDVVADGTDIIYSSVTISLSTAGIVDSASLGNIENLTLMGSAAIDATGNASANTIYGNSGNNVIAGMGGGDSLVGGGGSDIVDYRWATAAVEVNLAGFAITNAGNDSIDGFRGVYGSDHDDTLSGGGLDDTIRGGAGNDTLDGGAGMDTVDYSTATTDVTVDLLNGGVTGDGLGGVDIIDGFESAIGGSGADTILLGNTSGFAGGGGGSDSLTGGAGNDTLDGGAANDTLVGGGGDDRYFVDSTGDLVVEAADQGADSVTSSVSYTLASNVENLSLTGTAALTGTGNQEGNSLVGNAGNNTLTGLGGNDTLDGGLGNDTLIGGDGSDLYIVNAAGDRVRELGTGEDFIWSAVTISLSAAGVVELASLGNIEHVVLTGSAAINATGNALDNQLVGNDAANILDGKAGSDLMEGHGGDDTYVVDNAGDVVDEAADEGVDTVQASISYALGQHVEHLVLTGTGGISGTGNDLANRITGNAGSNTLDGGAGVDTLTGGNGNDTYVTDGNDVLVESTLAGGGIDTIVTANDSWTLALGFENLTFTSSDDSTGTGTTANNLIIGFEGNDTLIGLAGNDTLDGGLGVDSLVGGLGDDFYVVYEDADVVVELAGQGKDTVRSWISYDLLGTEIENLELQGSGDINGSGSAIANVITGNTGHNILFGDAGNDTLNGGDGDDTLAGGAGTDLLTGGNGNDLYIIDAISEVKELGAGLTGGRDTVAASISVTLSGGLANIEDVVFGGSANLNATGNAAANYLQGNAGNNLLAGLAGDDSIVGAGGNDTLDGGAGGDTLEGGEGNDRYLVDSNSDSTFEEADSGTDTVVSSVSWELNDNFEFLELTGTATQGFGNNGDNGITGNAGANTLDGSGGNDTLNGGGGADQLFGREGNDSFVYDALDTLVDGGADTDSLVVAGTLPAAGLNLAAVANLDDRFESLERIDLTGTGNNTLKFTAEHLKAMADFDADTGTFTIDGNVGDVVDSQGQDWQLQGIATIGDAFYVVYTVGDFTLQVNQDVTQIIS